MERLLPTHYFHVVFTLPAELRGVAMRNRRLVFDLIFAAASATLLDLGKDPKRLGARLGITMVLHTWARDLSFHPHVHAIVTGGGLSLDDARWASLRDEYIFPVEVMGALFRGKFLAGLAAAHARGKLDLGSQHGDEPVDPEAFDRLRKRLYAKSWHVYAKRPFGGPEQVIKYLGRYTHRVGISNARLAAMDDAGRVTFRTKNGAEVTLDAQVLVGRFLQHVLPDGFVKIRHYGILAPGNVGTRLVKASALLAAEAATGPVSTGAPLAEGHVVSVVEEMANACPGCGALELRRTAIPNASPHALERGPP